MLLPLKLSVLDYAIDHKDEAFKIEDIMLGLKNLYGKERQFNAKRIGEYCNDYLQNTFFVKDSVDIKDDGSVEITYRVTDYGCERGNKFIPTRKNK